MSKSCTCCGFPDAQNYGHYSACSMCLPRNPEERITEAVVKDSETTAKKAKVRQVTYKCESSLCDNNKTFHTSTIVLEWLE